MQPRVLIVDDDIVMREMLIDAVEAVGFLPVPAADGETALALFAQEPSDLVLLDIHLPGIDGFAVLESLRQQMGKTLPVILVSADDSAAIAERAYACGATDYTLKPLQFARLGFQLRSVWRDVCEQRKAIEQVAEAEKRYRLAFAFNPLAASLVRLDDGLFLEVNDAFCNILGLSREEIVGHFALDIGMWESPEVREQWADTLRQYGEVRDYRANWNHKRLGVRYCRVFASVVEVDGVPCILGMTRDDTDAIQSEKNAKTARQELSDIFSFLPEPTFVLNTQGVVVAWNHAMEKLCGVSALEVIGRGDYEVGRRLYNGERLPVLADLLLQGADLNLPRYSSIVREGDTIYGETDKIVINGRKLVVTGKASLLYNGEGVITGAVQTARDVTEIREAQKRLNKSEDMVRKLTLAVEQAPQSVLITDLSGRLEYVNQHFVDTSGYTREEAIGQKPSFRASGKTPSSTYRQLWATLAEGERWQGEFINRSKAGVESIERATILPIRQPDGLVSHYLSIQEDITERRHIEAELEQYRHHLEDEVIARTHELGVAKDHAEAANQAKSSFLANMSHEIRTPMNAILGMTHLLKSSSLTDKQLDQVSKVSDAANHLLSIINDILDFSKIEAGKLTLESGSVSLQTLLEHVSSLVASKVAEKGLHLTLHIDAACPPAIAADQLRLAQLLLNFASNAVKFTEHGTVQIKVCHAGEEGDLVRLRFEVIDQGIGISSEQQGRLFQAFEQADGSVTRRFGGTGLGLALCRRLAGLMGGEVGLDSVEGKGSTFWFQAAFKPLGGDEERLPESIAAVDPASLLAPWRGARLLMVEDNELNQEVALELLNAAHLSADVAGNGLEALKMVQATRYDLILMDMQMPLMDGLQATRRIRFLPEYRQTPILAMTANVFDDDRKRAHAAGMDDLVPKPVVPDFLYARLAYWLAERKVTPEVSGGVEEVKVEVPAASSSPSQSPSVAEAPMVVSALEALAALPGVNVEAGLAVARGKGDKYLGFLSKYVDMHKHEIDQLRSLLAESRYEEAARLAHTLKGVSGTLGLANIQANAGLIESQLKAGETAVDETVLLALASDLNALVAVVRSAAKS